MEITTENDITPETAKWLRERAGLTQADFWRSVASSPASGCNYEQNNVGIPRPVRRLIFLTYVANVPTEAGTRDDAERAVHAGRLYHIDLAGGRNTIAAVIAETVAQLKKASHALGI